jgi:sulfur carrier protein ThiS
VQVTIKLHGVFRLGRCKEMPRDYPPGTRVRQVVDDLDIPQQLLGIVLINGKHAGIDELLREGDVLSLLPFIDGG